MKLKKIFCILLSFTAMMCSFAFLSFGLDNKVSNCNISVNFDTEGSAFINQEWTVDFSYSHSDGFYVDIPIKSDERYSYSSLKDVYAGIDGMACSLSAEENSMMNYEPVDGTYSFEKHNDKISIKWNKINDGNVHTFRVTYTLTDVVKTVDSQTVFFCSYMSREQACRSEQTDITINYPQNCKESDVIVLTQNKYVGKKNGTSITFSGGKINEDVFIGIGLPSECFSNLQSYTTRPQGLTVFEISLIVIASVIVLICLFLMIFSQFVVRRYFIGKLKSSPYSESSYKKQKTVFNTFTPARVIKIVMNKNSYNRADLFIATVMSLAVKGYLRLEEGKIVPLNKKGDITGFEKSVIEFFDKKNTEPADFYMFVNKFNRQVHRFNIFRCIIPKNYSLIKRCFEIYLSSENYDSVDIEKLSTYVFKESRVTDVDVAIALIKDNQGCNKCNSGLFCFRDIYSQGLNDILNYKKGN